MGRDWVWIFFFCINLSCFDICLNVVFVSFVVVHLLLSEINVVSNNPVVLSLSGQLTRGIEMVRTLRLHTTRERRDYFLCILMFKYIHGLVPHYLCNDVTMYVDLNGYDTRSAENMDLYLPRCSREIYKKSFLYKDSSLWNQLPSCLKESISKIDFKRNSRLLYGWRLS